MSLIDASDFAKGSVDNRRTILLQSFLASESVAIFIAPAVVKLARAMMNLVYQMLIEGTLVYKVVVAVAAAELGHMRSRA